MNCLKIILFPVFLSLLGCPHESVVPVIDEPSNESSTATDSGTTAEAPGSDPTDSGVTAATPSSDAGAPSDAGNHSSEPVPATDAGASASDAGASAVVAEATTSDAGTGATSDAGNASAVDESAWYQCTENSDCVLEERGCCDFCNGGTLHSVNQAYLADFTAAYPPTELPCLWPDGSPWMCTQVYCLPHEPYCNAGTCDHRMPGSGDEEEPDDAGLGQADNDGDGYPDVWFSCNQASDCVAYQPDCCSYCDGGDLHAVNQNYLSEVEAAIPATSSEICGNVQCLGAYCEITLECINNVCSNR